MSEILISIYVLCIFACIYYKKEFDLILICIIGIILNILTI